MSGTAAAPSLFMAVAGGDAPAGLRVLHVISSMAPEAGGPPAVCRGLAEALAVRGHRVTIATVEDPNHAAMQVSPPVALHTFRRTGGPRYARSIDLDAWLRNHVRDFDIVHLHSVWQFPTFAAARVCWREKKPYVVLLNGMLDRYVVERRSRWLKRAYWGWREGKIARRAKGIHCLNQAEIRRAVPWIGAMPKFVIGNGISGSELDHLPARGKFRARHPQIGERPLALFLSRVHPKKGLDRLIPAWRALADRRQDLRLAIAGTGDADYVASIDRLIAANGLEGCVVRVGQLVGIDKWEALVDADLFVLPSHQEGFSMAITEALGAGCPAVVTEECNFDELEERMCGVVVRGGDMTAFLGAVEMLIDDVERRKIFGAAGAAMVRERYMWQKIAADLESVYRWVLVGKGLPTDGADVWR